MLEVSSIVIHWIFFAYLSYIIGNKLHIKKSYPWYLIPLWNFLVLAKESELKIKKFFLTLLLLLIVFLLGCFLYLYLSMAFETATFVLNRVAYDFILNVIIVFSIAIFWGSVAEKMGKEYGVYILFGVILIYLPPLLLAFDSIDKFFTSHSMFRLSQEEKELLSISGEAMDMRGKKINYGIVYLLVPMISSYIYSFF